MENPRLSVPLALERTTTYLLIIADLGSEGRAPIGQFAFQLSDLTFGTTVPELRYDEATNSVVQDDTTSDSDTTTTDGTTVTTVCPSLSFTCDDFFTCDEAQACHDAGNFSLDADGNGVPCEQTVCFGVTSTDSSTEAEATQEFLVDPTLCPSLEATCTELTADQVAPCYAAGNFSLDLNNNDIACEGIHDIFVGNIGN